MINVKSVAFNEKGNLRPEVRDVVADYVKAHKEVFLNAEQVGDKNTFVLPVKDADGAMFYINFDFTVSALSAANRAPKKAKPKADKEVIVVE